MLGGRPLVFMFGAAANLTEVTALRRACHDALGVDPYVVSMTGQYTPGLIDATSAYTVAAETSLTGTPFQTAIVAPSLEQWERNKKTSVPIVPTVVRYLASPGWWSPRAAGGGGG